MNILQIGELAKGLSEEFLNAHSSIPWRQIIRTRDVYAHHYGAIEYEVVWETAHDGILELSDYLKSI
jgi:uncharacterized protein with HEPN domain